MPDYARKIESLEQAVRTAPEYGEIVPLFISLYRYLAANGERSGLSLPIDAAAARGRLHAGFPMIAPGDLRVDGAACAEFLSGTFEVLRNAGRDGKGELNLLEAAVRDGRLDLEALFGAVLERRRAVLDEASRLIGVSSPLLEYVVEIPLRAALERFAEGVGAPVVAEWQEALCPVCGSRPGMAELAGDEGRRLLCCSACSFRWPFRRLQCPYCGNEDAQKLSYFTAGEGTTRVDVCGACSRYIKTRDSRKGGGDVPPDVADLLTLHLDLLAAREGYERGK